MRRRALLSGLACGSVALLAGCNSSSPENEVEVTVTNSSTAAISMDVFFTRGDSETVFSAHYQLDADTRDESKQFTGQFERVYAIVDESTVMVESIDNTPCSGTNRVPVGIYYKETDELSIGGACSQ